MSRRERHRIYTLANVESINQSLRLNEKSIIEMVAPHFTSTTALGAISRIRMFHNNMDHVSDISTIDGKGLDQAFLAGNQL